ncbi:zinc-binding dehydrogenase [Actinomadura physcomitrii]|nr:zinc-binding dehydrogenase [Actinomadura physcomitrii]
MVIRPQDDALELRDVPSPVPDRGELLVAVAASGVNRADLLQRRGAYTQIAFPQREPRIAGMEAAGTVIATGPDVTRFSPGDRVMGLCAGGFAERVVLDARLALPVPAELDMVAAGALPLGLMTEYDAMAGAGRLRPGERVLITAGSSGVGLIGVQVARALGAGRVIATVRSDAGREAVLRQGADEAVVTGERWPDTLPEADLVIDHVGAPALAGALAALPLGGRLVSVGRLGGRTAQLDMNELARKRLLLAGVTFRTRTREECAAIAAGAVRDLGEAVRAGTVRPAVARTFPLAAAQEAQDLPRDARGPGKVVVIPG